MGITFRRSSDIDTSIALHSQAVREDRMQRRNDDRRAAGLSVQHCGVDAATNEHGDHVCAECGDIF